MVEGETVAQDPVVTEERARAHVAERAWGAAREELVAADAQGLLDAGGLELLGTVAWLAGDGERSRDAMARAHRAHLDAGADDRATTCAFWLGMQLLNLGDPARGGGWIERAQRTAADLPADGPHAGYLELPGALQALSRGEADRALAAFSRAHEVGRRHAERDLEALGLLGRGQALVALGRTDEGLAALDEVMVSVTTEEVSPIVAGIAYCGVIESCHRAWDLQRARTWTRALGEWCDGQPDLVPFRGQCMVHRAQVMQLQGQWPDAMANVEEARRRFSEPPTDMAVGAACYEQAELHRLRGELAAAEDAYASASEWGHAPQPGQSLLRLAQGRTADAVAAIRRVAAETSGDLPRARVLPAMVEILLAAGEVDAARDAAEELATIATGRSVPQLDATAVQATGAVLLAEGRWGDALEHLRRAMVTWLDLQVPHEAARVRILVARACAALGDADSAAVELAAARRACEALGAQPQLAVIDELATGADRGQRPGGLTAREAEVLVQVATGRTNREVARELHISDKTVARHLSNIFTKLDLSSRAAATAWAYEHDLV